MFFKRTQRYQLPIRKEELLRQLAGNHVSIHGLDFEVYEDGEKVEIAPHAELIKDLKTLPVTDVHIEQRQDGNTEVVVTSRIRKIDSGGPLLIMLFSAFLMVASVVLLAVGRERLATYFLFGVSTTILTIFWIRMEIGYFDYVRKIQHFVKDRLGLLKGGLGNMQVG